MVMGGDSCTIGHGFESQRRILFVVKIEMLVRKDENK